MLSLPKASVTDPPPFIAVITRIFDEFNLILQTRKLCLSIQLLHTKLLLPQFATLLNYLNCVIFENTLLRSWCALRSSCWSITLFVKML